MSRIVNFVLLTIMLIGAVVTYNMKLRAEKAAERVVRLEKSIEDQKDAIQLLRAELSALVQPARLQAVVERHDEHFKLQEFERSQYATVEDIPMRLPDSAVEAMSADVENRDGGDVPLIAPIGLDR